MKRIKTLSLSIAEISEIFRISNPQVREEAISIIEAVAADPENVCVDSFADAPAIIQKLLQKIRKRVELSHRRAEARARRQAELANQSESSTPAEQQSQSEAYRKLHEAAEKVIEEEAKSYVSRIGFPKSATRRYYSMSCTMAKPFNWLDSNFDKFIEQIDMAFASIPDYTFQNRSVRVAACRSLNAIKDFLTPYIHSARRFVNC